MPNSKVTRSFKASGMKGSNEVKVTPGGSDSIFGWPVNKSMSSDKKDPISDCDMAAFQMLNKVGTKKGRGRK
jgi:hypothetical protein